MLTGWLVFWADCHHVWHASVSAWMMCCCCKKTVCRANTAPTNNCNYETHLKMKNTFRKLQHKMSLEAFCLIWWHNIKMIPNFWTLFTACICHENCQNTPDSLFKSVSRHKPIFLRIMMHLIWLVQHQTTQNCQTCVKLSLTRDALKLSEPMKRSETFWNDEWEVKQRSVTWQWGFDTTSDTLFRITLLRRKWHKVRSLGIISPSLNFHLFCSVSGCCNSVLYSASPGFPEPAFLPLQSFFSCCEYSVLLDWF